MTLGTSSVSSPEETSRIIKFLKTNVAGIVGLLIDDRNDARFGMVAVRKILAIAEYYSNLVGAQQRIQTN